MITSFVLRAVAVVSSASGTGFREPARWVDDPQRTRRVLIIGDSMAATDFGVALERRLDAHPKVDCRRFGKSATGLARPDFYDWTKQAQRLVKRHDPDLVVVIMGGNDGQDLVNVRGKGRVRYRSSAWEPEYERRLYHFGELLAGEGRRVLWLELPAMARSRFEAKLRQIRRLQEETAALIARNRYLRTRDYFYDLQGRLRKYVPVRGKKSSPKKRRVLMRQEDGIHFSLPGAVYFARSVVSEVLVGLELGTEGMLEGSARPEPAIWMSSKSPAASSSPSRRADR